MDYEWNIMQCDNCNEYYAIPTDKLMEIDRNIENSIICPFCGAKRYIWSANQGSMKASKGLKKEIIVYLSN